MTTEETLASLRDDIARLEEKLDDLVCPIHTILNALASGGASRRLLTRDEAMAFLSIRSPKSFRRDVTNSPNITVYYRTGKCHRQRMYDPEELAELQRSWGEEEGLVEDMGKFIDELFNRKSS